MGGHIMADSEPGRGSTFYLFLPFCVKDSRGNMISLRKEGMFKEHKIQVPETSADDFEFEYEEDDAFNVLATTEHVDESVPEDFLLFEVGWDCQEEYYTSTTATAAKATEGPELNIEQFSPKPKQGAISLQMTSEPIPLRETSSQQATGLDREKMEQATGLDTEIMEQATGLDTGKLEQVTGLDTGKMEKATMLDTGKMEQATREEFQPTKGNEQARKLEQATGLRVEKTESTEGEQVRKLEQATGLRVEKIEGSEPEGFQPTKGNEQPGKLEQATGLIVEKTESNETEGFQPTKGKEQPRKLDAAASKVKSTLRTELVIDVNPLETAAKRPSYSPPSAGAFRILLVEDNIVNQKVAAKLLEKFGHVVSIVADGVQAVDAVHAHRDDYDLVLMDIQMPNMDGLEATRCIRSEEEKLKCKKLPIIGLTAHAMQGYQETCFSAGMNGYMPKPFQITQVLALIQKVLSSPREVHITIKDVV